MTDFWDDIRERARQHAAGGESTNGTPLQDIVRRGLEYARNALDVARESSRISTAISKLLSYVDRLFLFLENPYVQMYLNAVWYIMIVFVVIELLGIFFTYFDILGYRAPWYLRMLGTADGREYHKKGDPDVKKRVVRGADLDLPSRFIFLAVKMVERLIGQVIFSTIFPLWALSFVWFWSFHVAIAVIYSSDHILYRNGRFVIQGHNNTLIEERIETQE